VTIKVHIKREDVINFFLPGLIINGEKAIRNRLMRGGVEGITIDQ